MSGILHSLRNIFSPKNTNDNNNNRRRITTRSRAREEEENNPGSDDDVFSTFGDDETEERMQTQEEDVAIVQPLQQQHSESTTTTTSNNSLATQPLLDHSEETTTTATAAEDVVNNDQTNNDDSNSNIDQQQQLSPLADFFSHIITNNNDKDVAVGVERERRSLAAYHNAHNNNQMSSYKEWKAARKHILQQYLTYRLIGPDDDDDSSMEDGNGDGASSSSINDDCSFSSNLLDEPFDMGGGNEDGGGGEDLNMTANTSSSGAANDASNMEVESEDEDDDNMLETQPQTAPPPLKSNYEGEEDNDMEEEEEEEETPLNTQQEEELTPTTRREGIFSGIKRKLGFGTTTTTIAAEEGGQSSSQGLEEQQEEQPSTNRKKRARTNNPKKKKRGSSRGLMWDGTFQSIPHVEDATEPSCYKLQELDLLCQSLNLPLCRVLRIWDVRSTKRMDNLMPSEEEEEGGGSGNGDNDPSSVMTPYEFCEDDGPLNTIYKRVFSIEVAQIIDSDTQSDSVMTALRSPSVTNMTTAVFHDGKDQLERETSRKRRHSVRKVRIFFYNKYADVMAAALHDLARGSSLQKKKKKKIVPFLMSLSNIPAECIMPRLIAPKGSHPHLQQYVMNPIGDDELGVSSPYCICIGDKSSIKFGEQKLYFDHDELEIRLVEEPVNIPLTVIDNGEKKNNDFVLDDAIVTAESIQYGHGYYMEGEQSDLVKQYVQLRKRTKSLEPMLINLEEDDEEEEEEEENNDPEAANNPGLAGLRGSAMANNDNGGATKAPRTKSRAAAGESEASGGGGITRPRMVVPLCNLHPLLLQNNMKRLKESITAVYGVVLGFSPPSLTKSEEWMMAVVLIDDTIPLSNQTRAPGQPSNTTVNPGGGDSSSNPKDLHVPSVTLMIFSKDKAKLPVVRSAGDVICCEKVILQAWNGEAQLCARTHRQSNIVIVSPKQPRRPGDDIQNSTSPDDWSVSCSCHVRSTENQTHTIKNLSLVNKLWIWGQQRLSNHPTMSPNCYLSIAGVGNDHDGIEVSASGDLTAAVTAIIPMPVNLLRRDTPRGFVRLWDGTGPPRCDPPPQNSSVPNQPSDPPEELLLEIEKIVGDISSSSSSEAGRPLIQAPITLCGRVINAIIWEEQLWNLIQREHIINIGSFVRLRNVNKARLPTLATTNCLSVHAKSSLTPLPFDAYEVKELLLKHSTSGAQPNPTSALLPTRSNNNRSEAVAQAMRNTGLSMIEECLQMPPPASFTIQFEAVKTIPECNPTTIESLKVLCTRKNDGKSSFRFALNVRDSSSTMDVLCLGQVAEEVLGITAQEIYDERQDKCEEAIKTLKELMSPGSVCEGKVKSIVGKDGKLYFILKSMFCITAETV